jgi:membrane-bound lytic murein transglycosylase D
MVSGLRRWAVAIGCVPLALLAGCPQQQKIASSGVPANAAPPVIVAPPPIAAPAPAITQAQAIDIATRAYKVQQLIHQVEGAYQSGVDNYRGGKLEAARSDFDMAVDLMLTSGMDVTNDAQLSDEFEHVLNAINSLEMSALKQGTTGFSARSRPRRWMPPMK